MEFKKLIEEIAVQAELLNEMLMVLERETSEMADVNIAAMNLSNHHKEDLTDRIAKHTPYLQEAIKQISALEGLSGNGSLSILAEHIAKKGNRELLAKQEHIRSIAERVKQAASLNLEIAERFSVSVSSSFNLITRLINQSNVYGASGGYKLQSAGAVMINREA